MARVICSLSTCSAAALSAGIKAGVKVPSGLASTASPQLVTSYSACTELLLDEIAATETGDEINLGIYLLEGGESSERVLGALVEAGSSRGVSVNCTHTRSEQ